MDAFHTAATLEAHLTLAQMGNLMSQLTPEQQTKIILDILSRDEDKKVIDAVRHYLAEWDLL